MSEEPQTGPAADVKSILKRRRRRQSEENVCLRGDLAGEYEQLEKRLADLPKNNKLSGDPQRQQILDDMDRIRAEMQRDTVTFVLRALPEAAFQALIDEHPPRRDGDDIDERDARLGFDRSTFYRPLIRACTVEPELDDEDWDLLLGGDGLSPGDFHRLSLRALELNGQEVDVPFSPAASNGSPG
jgi:hypothetical protein